MRLFLMNFLVWLLASTAISLNDDEPAAAANALSTHHRSLSSGIERILVSAAEKMPQENYGFKPTDGVRTFAQIVGHVADSQYAFCSAVLGEKPPRLEIEKTKIAKADLIASLKEAFAYCRKASDGMTDTSAAQPVKFMGGQRPRLGVLTVNNTHTIEHYGNLVTYMRMKNVVPPTSDPEFMKGMSSEKK